MRKHCCGCRITIISADALRESIKRISLEGGFRCTPRGSEVHQLMQPRHCHGYKGESSMSFQDTTTAPAEIIDPLRASAHAKVDSTNDIPTLLQIIAAGPAPSKEKKSPSEKSRGVDATIDQYRESFSAATKKVNEEGHMKLGALLDWLNAGSKAPFHRYDRPTCIHLLARHFQRSARRLEPPCTPKQATEETEVWTKEAWFKHHAS